MPEIVHGQVVDGHLGGYVPGGDPNTTYPTLWRWLVEDFGIRSVLDVGCGDGVAMDAFIAAGAERVQGVDGMEIDRPDVQRHDYTVGPRDDGGLFANSDYDLVWSAEFVEHVEERYVPNFLRDFALGTFVAMTHAVPGQGGWHHVNCRMPDYWLGALHAIGYELDGALTGTARELAHEDVAGWGGYFGRTGMVFRRRGE